MKIKRIISLFIIMFIAFVTTSFVKISATVSTSNSITIEGAQIRTSGKQGLRFVANKDEYIGTNVTAWGILIAYGEVEASDSFVKDGTVNEKSVLCVEMNTVNSENKFAATLINIPEREYVQKVTARAYVIDDGNYVYSTTVVIRSIYQVAQLVKETVGYTTNTIIENVISISKAYTQGAPIRVDVNGDSSPTGNYMYFGSYPQNKVTDSSLITTLNSLYGDLPTAEASANWTSYGFFDNGSNEVDYTWYIDVVNDNIKYRGVYFTSYRPYGTVARLGEANYQDDHGYLMTNVTPNSNVFWFQYKPIKWKILTTSNEEITLFSDLILDSQDFNHSITNTIIDEKTIYPNNYEKSSLREWLNNNFYNEAFDKGQQLYIQTTEVDNSKESTDNPTNNPYACNNTNDNVYLLSYQDVINTSYGFTISDNTLRKKLATDYAKCMGVWAVDGMGYWWLRSTFNNGSSEARTNARLILTDGNIASTPVYSTCGGIAPVLKIK